MEFGEVTSVVLLFDQESGGGICNSTFLAPQKMEEFKNNFKMLENFFPINIHNNHWVLLTTDKDEKAIKVFASMGKKNEYYTKALLKVQYQLKKDEQWVV